MKDRPEVKVMLVVSYNYRYL